MRHKVSFSYIRIFIALWGILWLCAVSAVCQVRFGVFWQGGRDNISHIDPGRYAGMKITHFVIGRSYVNEMAMPGDSAKKQQIHILAAPPLGFLTSYDLEKHEELFIKRLYRELQPFITDIHPDGYGVIRLSEIQSERFATLLRPVINQLKDSVRSSIFYIRQANSPNQKDFVSDLFDFSLVQINENTNLAGLPSIITPKTRGIYFAPESDDYFNLPYLQTLFRFIRNNPQLVLYLNGKWLQSVIRDHPGFKSTITDYATDPNAVFSNPPVGHVPVKAGYPVLILVLIWFISAIHYGFEPNYRKSLIRYFGYHRFFIDDIQERILRFANSNVIVMLIHALTGALFLITFTHFFISKTGFQAIAAHYPIFNLLAGSDVQLFLTGFLGIIIFNLICSVWIFVSSPDFPQYNQVLTLYLWPQHINIILVSLLVTFTIAYQSTVLIYLCGLFYVIVLFSSFVIASTDVYIYTENKGIFLIKSLIPYLILVIIVLTGLFGYTGVTDVWKLARLLL